MLMPVIRQSLPGACDLTAAVWVLYRAAPAVSLFSFYLTVPFVRFTLANTFPVAWKLGDFIIRTFQGRGTLKLVHRNNILSPNHNHNGHNHIQRRCY